MSWLVDDDLNLRRVVTSATRVNSDDRQGGAVPCTARYVSNRLVSIQWRHWGVGGGRTALGDTRLKLIFVAEFRKECWKNDVGRWEWWRRQLKKVITAHATDW